MTDNGAPPSDAAGRPLERIGWPVRTERLALRPGTPADAEATWSFRRLESVNRWLTSAPQTFDDYRSEFEQPDRLAKTIVIELDGQIIGDLMLAVQDAWSQTEVAERAAGVQASLGWVVHPDHSGRGYATEAVTELLRLCFEELGLRRVIADCFTDNEPSWRLMERIGMRRETHNVRDSLHRSGEWLDGLGYALLADEWSGGGDPRGKNGRR